MVGKGAAMVRTAPALLLLAAAGTLAGCDTLATRPGRAPRPSAEVQPPEPWRQAASDADVALLDRLPAMMAAAHPLVPKAAAGPLLDPAAALPRAAPAPGVYTCRLLRLRAGPTAARTPPAASGFCFVGVEKERLSLTLEAGPERLGGYLWEGKESRRLVFLGTAAPRRSGALKPYGADPAADVPGVFERTGPFRYRLVLPARDGDRLSVYQLTVAPAQ